MSDKSLSSLIRHLRSMGLTVVFGRRGGHAKVYQGDRYVCSVSLTPTNDDLRWKEVRRDLRRAGITGE